MSVRVILRRRRHQGKKVIVLIFPFNRTIIELVKKVAGTIFSHRLQCWYVAESVQKRDELCALLLDGGIEVIDETGADRSSINDETRFYLKEFREWLEYRRYSERTIKNYYSLLEFFFAHFPEVSVKDIDAPTIISFVREHVLKYNFSASYQNLLTSALKLFYLRIEDRDLELRDLPHVRQPKTLPQVLSKEQVKRMIEGTANLKHRAMLSAIYSCGLRAGELLKMKPHHIDSDRLTIRIEQAKGKKDRVVPLSERLLELLREYYKAYRPKKYLFEGQMAGQPYNMRSLQQIVRQAAARAGITRKVTSHWLRHSYATHLLESGTDIRYIQELLGHTHSKTTEIYTHVSMPALGRIRNPFDDL